MAARCPGELVRRWVRRVRFVDSLMCPLLPRVDLREGRPLAEASSAEPPLLFERLSWFRASGLTRSVRRLTTSVRRGLLGLGGCFVFWLLS